MNPNAEEFLPKQPLADTRSCSVTDKSSLIFNANANEFVPSSWISSFVDSGTLGVEEDWVLPTYLNENGNNNWLVVNPPTLEDVPFYTQNELPSEASLDDGVVVYKPWNKIGFEGHEVVYNPDASEFLPSYKDFIPENDRGHRPIHRNTVYTDNDQQFLHSNYFEDQQGLVRPQEPPPPFPHTPPEYSHITVAPLYVLIGVQPHRPKPKKRVTFRLPAESMGGGDQLIVTTPSYVTLPRNGNPLLPPMKLSPDDSTNGGTSALKSSAELKPLHKKLEKSFTEFEKHIEDFYGVNRRDLRDDALSREMDRASKKQQIAKPQIVVAPKETLIKLNEQQAAPRGYISLGRSMGSFSSTMSLYQNHPKHKSQKSMGYFKRASQTSFSGSMEGDQMIVTTPSSATLPRNGNPFFPPMKLSPVDSTNEGTASQESLIPLTQVLISQRPPRSHAEQRKSQSWTATGESRSSIISVNSLEFPRQNNSYPSEPGSRTSVTSPEFEGKTESRDETVPPPVPPKQRDNLSPVHVLL